MFIDTFIERWLLTYVSGGTRSLQAWFPMKALVEALEGTVHRTAYSEN